MHQSELVAEMLKRIDVKGMERVREVFPNTTHDKFFRVEEFVNAAAAHAIRLNDELQPRSRCLDVGCGFGYVALALECLGHSCVAWDNTAPVLRNVALMIPLKERMFVEIRRDGEQRELTDAYDLIFLHGVVPLRDAGGWWDWPSYSEFFRMLMNALNPGGMLEIIANWGDQIPVACNATAWDLLMHPGLSCSVGGNIITVRREGIACAV